MAGSGEELGRSVGGYLAAHGFLRFAEEIEILAPEAPRAERLDAAAIRTAGDDFAVAPAEPEETHARW